MITFTEIEKKAATAEELDAFRGIKLSNIKDKITSILALIGRGGIFDEYTKHDISHIDQMLQLADKLIPDVTKKIMTSADWLMLVLAFYFHDMGMLVTKDEYKERENSKGFKDYTEKIMDGSMGLEYKEAIMKLIEENKDYAEHFIYQEFVRKHHAERIKYWIQGKQKDELGIANKIIDEINELLKPLPTPFKKDLAIVCESHHLSDLDDFKKYKISQPYGNTEQEIVNLQYCALILRTADLLHITSDRTPSIEFSLINPNNPISQLEWLKQTAITNVRPQVKTNKEGMLDTSLQMDTIEVTAYFDKPEKAEGFFSLISYLNYARKEIEQSYRYGQIANKTQASQYEFPWKNISDEGVEADGFERELFKFTLDQEKILNLLVGHTLYNDPTVVLRELIQNSIDAIRLQRTIEKSCNQGSIQIKWNSKTRILEILDNGTGMDRNIIENHLLKVGSSRYQDEKFKKLYPEFSPISRFGIGILTSFLISNDIILSSSTKDEREALNLTIQNVDGKYLLRYLEKEKLDNLVKEHGTHIQLKVRPDVKMDSLELDIKKWVLFPACAVHLIIDNKNPINIGYSSPKIALEEYMKQIGYQIGEKIKVEEKTLDGVTMAYAIEYLEYYREWVFFKGYPRVIEKSLSNPIGTAVEGIRVEFVSPGFLGKKLYAIANATGKDAPKTNVARSLLEDTKEKTKLLETIYSIYFLQIESEIENLHNVRGFSPTWAADETNYLLGPFIDKNSNANERFEPQSPFLLDKAINEISGIVIERKQERKLVNPAYIINADRVLTIDCDLFRSAESLIKQVSVNTSLISLLDAIYKEEGKISADNLILCGYSKGNRLHANALSNKEIIEINVFPKERRVDLAWGNIKNKKKWLIPKRATVTRQGIRTNTEILVQQDDIKITGLSDEIAVGSFGKTYFLKGSPYHAFLLQTLEKFNEEIPETGILVDFIIDLGLRFLAPSSKTLVTSSDLENAIEYLIENNTNRRYLKNESLNKVIYGGELKDAVLKTNWSIFDTRFWHRELPI